VLCLVQRLWPGCLTPPTRPAAPLRRYQSPHPCYRLSSLYALRVTHANGLFNRCTRSLVLGLCLDRLSILFLRAVVMLLGW